MGIIEKIIKLDHFGAFFALTIQGETSEYRSIMGAFATLFIYLTSMTYFCFLFFIWITDQSVPSMAGYTKFMKDGKTFDISNNLFSLNYEAYDNETLALLKGKYLYNVSTQHYIGGGIFEEPYYRPNCQLVYQMDAFDPICMDLENQYQKKLSQNQKDQNSDTYLGFLFYPCNNSEQNCIYGDDQKNFINSFNGDGKLTLFTQQFDLKEQKLNIMPQDLYFPLHFEQNYFLNLQVTVTRLRITKGVFFVVEEYIEFVSSIGIQTYFIERNFGDPYVSLSISLSRQQVELQIEYPMLTQILSQLSSVFSGLLGFGIIFNQINQKILKKTLVNKIGSIYFSNFNEFMNDHQNLVNYKKKQKIEDLAIELTQKCNFFNILHEISRIQFALQTIIPKEKLLQIQKMKYKLNLQIENIKLSSYELHEDDFRIFSTRTFLEHEDLLNKCNFKKSKVKPCEKENDLININSIRDEEQQKKDEIQEQD